MNNTTVLQDLIEWINEKQKSNGISPENYNEHRSLYDLKEKATSLLPKEKEEIVNAFEGITEMNDDSTQTFKYQSGEDYFDKLYN